MPSQLVYIPRIHSVTKSEDGCNRFSAIEIKSATLHSIYTKLQNKLPKYFGLKTPPEMTFGVVQPSKILRLYTSTRLFTLNAIAYFYLTIIHNDK